MSYTKTVSMKVSLKSDIEPTLRAYNKLGIHTMTVQISTSRNYFEKFNTAFCTELSESTSLDKLPSGSNLE